MNRKGHHVTAVLTVSVPMVIGLKQQLPWPVILASVLGCCWGVTAPDDVEIRYLSVNGRSRDGERDTYVSKTLLAHRGISHDIMVWIGLFLCAWWWQFCAPAQGTDGIWPLVKGAAFGTTYGALIHLLADLPNERGIQLFPFGPRVCLHLWHASENQVVTCFVLGGMATVLSAKIWLGEAFALREISTDTMGVLHLIFEHVRELLVSGSATMKHMIYSTV